MPLFQQSVLRKYISELDKNALSVAWKTFQSHFHNLVMQAHIRQLKEEQYQEGFLRDLFVEVLGYTLNPQPGFNLTTEYKNEKDSKKADGAILKAGAVRAVVELKGTDTTDLSRIEGQAFGYLHNQKGCTYVITANFEKLRFYIQDATDYMEFNLFALGKDEFDMLYLCLQADSLLADIPLQVKQQSVTQEDTITKKLYADYSTFKQALYQDLVSKNPHYDKIELFKKSQKLLDRFLFILFAEDRLLLPPNFIVKIVEENKHVQKLRLQQSLYERFKIYFTDLLNGNREEDIFAYNGGLFEPDDVLDRLVIADDILQQGVLRLSQYDYNTEVDVNILGHIFEHSLNEIEELQARLGDAVVDRAKTRRKKEGVFYTPRYITKYIVENTVGTLCKEKKEALQIVEEDYAPAVKKTKASEAQRRILVQKLDDYRSWLLGLTICDPACGSGAFLNAALEFLITEHKYIDELTNKLMGASIGFTWTPNDILEHNLFGVDLNEEAVEIARLSLWLRTAQKGRKLSNLSGNIKAGNSLIEDPAIAGEKAFIWKQKFKKVFEMGGFDVVIGNPPYVDIKGLPRELVESIFKIYSTANNRINLFSVFIERSFSLLKSQGKFSFIIPSSLLTQESYKEIRKEIVLNCKINTIVRLPNESFGGGAGEVKVDTIILTFSFIKYEGSNVEVIIYKGYDRINEIRIDNADNYILIEQSNWLNDENYNFRINVDEGSSNVVMKCEVDSFRLIECAEFCLGLTPYDKYRGHTTHQIENRVFHANFQKDSSFKKLLAGNDVRRYNVSWNGDEWISYGNWLGAPREQRFFTQKRILVKQIIDWTAKRIWAVSTEEELYNTQNAFNLIAKKGYLSEFLLAIINSKLMTFYLNKKFLEEYKDRFQKILIKDCKEFPIKNVLYEQQQLFVEPVNLMLSKNKELHTLKETLLKFLQAKHENLSFSKKLTDWPSLSFKEFLKELEKQKVKFSLPEQAEWLAYFEGEKAKASNLQQLINQTDNELDEMVYQLYNLTPEEIAIVKQSFSN
jgi:type I restriction-modification system DNA methylase subunit